MKKIWLVILSVSLPLLLQSQEPAPKKDIGDEPYPAPVMYQNISLEQAALIGQFENQEVSNLHVYTNPNASPDYFFEGSPIGPQFSQFFEGKMARQTFVEGKEPQAVFSLRGEAEELYIVRLPGEEWDYELALFGWDDGKLKKRQTLAFFTCKGNRCIQQDSWLRDVNGDTRLDVVQKKKTTRKGGKKVKIRSDVYLMGQTGMLRKSRSARVDFEDYQMQDLKSEKN